MKLSIITVSFNASGFIEDYLKSLEKNLPPQSEVIIVDNNSKDETVKIIKSFRFVKLIQNNSNLGFSKSSNLGAKEAKGEYLLFLNHDTKVLDSGIKILLEYIQIHPDIGILAPKLIDAKGDVQKSVTNFPTLWRAIQEYFFNKKNAYWQFAPKVENPVEVEAVYGAAMMIPGKIFKEVGGFDERYFLYYEDIDICRKVHNMGFKVVYLPEAKFNHLIGASMKKEQNMPLGIRTLSWFIPIKSSGSRYYMIKSGAIYHGVFISTLMKVLMYFGLKTKNEL